jgi:hypothetical protein
VFEFLRKRFGFPHAKLSVEENEAMVLHHRNELELVGQFGEPEEID